MSVSQYVCKICGNTVKLHVAVSVPPTCNNDKHKTRPTVMDLKEKVSR